MSAEAENIPTNVASGAAEGAKAKKTKEAKPKKKPAAEKKKAPKKKTSSSPPSHPKYEDVRFRFRSKSFIHFQIRNYFN